MQFAEAKPTVERNGEYERVLGAISCTHHPREFCKRLISSVQIDYFRVKLHPQSLAEYCGLEWEGEGSATKLTFFFPMKEFFLEQLWTPILYLKKEVLKEASPYSKTKTSSRR